MSRVQVTGKILPFNSLSL